MCSQFPKFYPLKTSILLSTHATCMPVVFSHMIQSIHKHDLDSVCLKFTITTRILRILINLTFELFVPYLRGDNSPCEFCSTWQWSLMISLHFGLSSGMHQSKSLAQLVLTCWPSHYLPQPNHSIQHAYWEANYDCGLTRYNSGKHGLLSEMHALGSGPNVECIYSDQVLVRQ